MGSAVQLRAVGRPGRPRRAASRPDVGSGNLRAGAVERGLSTVLPDPGETLCGAQHNHARQEGAWELQVMREPSWVEKGRPDTGPDTTAGKGR